MISDWSVRRAGCDYCAATLTMLRVRQQIYSEWQHPAGDWLGAEGHELYHRAIEAEVRAELAREVSSR